ncbi:MAG TPA: SUMF1/EgtB/PvdO family nonheme iron enzyme [Polyangiaceae bacterium]
MLRRSPTLSRAGRLALGGFVVVSGACRATGRTPREDHEMPATSASTALSALGAPSASATGAAAAASAPVAQPSCPNGMALLPGGAFWVGSERREHFSDDESPRFRTELPPFCIDQTEVTVLAYAECVAQGKCMAADASHGQCNAAHRDRPDYPINCVTWPEADQYCQFRGARLPSEAEWEYAARGGEQYLKYPWGDAAPDGHTCWKHAGGSCKTKAFPAGAFDLYDLSGNVWEWTDDWYGPYPWPPESGFAKVYRGGSWSRRFEKWMHTRLRDRAKPSDQGAHLGFRCASVPDLSRCPFGKADEQRCLAGVTDCECPQAQNWNGVRCAKPGAARCPQGWQERAGRGCVPGVPVKNPLPDLEADARSVTRLPAPEFEADCQANFGDRKHAFRYVGGTHSARNLVSGRAGCKNRDVGVGFNSCCCP